MTPNRFTKTSVAALIPRTSTYIEYDAELPGFGVRVTPNGAKSFVVDYRANGGGRGAPTRRYTIGSSTTFSADAARKAARDVLARVRLGADPAKEKAIDRKAVTIADIERVFMEEEIRPTCKPRTTALYAMYFRVHVLPELGSKRAFEVSHTDIVRLHRKIGLRTKPTANRVVSLISAMFTWGVKTRRIPIEANPARGVQLFPEQPRERYLTSDEMLRLGDAIREAETKGIPYEIDETRRTSKHAAKPDKRITKISPYAAAAIRLLLLTGARLREILDLRWPNVDLERGLLFLPDSKSGKKTIVLNTPALLILSSLPRIGEFVIAGQSAGADDEKPRADLQRPWRAITKRAGLSGVRMHDLRHTHASIGVGAGLGLPIIGRLLGHSNVETTQRYAHLADDPVRRASERIGDNLSRAMGDA
ncbi:site-specific integrase [Bradyrhizobium sp. Ash2021]|uniref:tyrosine-type recombinase/integrase n=1 Tax=Bradyrhizobium sp. Ash2021 TaxID=2954771 RepID=UPI0028168D05|nr:site-specific integrase [Bradyrhizobium sp. Ash2021]WMT78764.1 site-specific integrase [Bradyrhizobium sp. Ash2021]